MLKKQTLLILFFLIGGFFSSLQAQEAEINSEYTETAKELIQVSGLEKALRGTATVALNRLKALKPRVPNSLWEQLAQEAEEMPLDNIYNRLVPVYWSSFSEKEIKKLIRFYNKKLGQKVAASLVPLQQATFEASMAWGDELGRHFGERLAQEGY